MSDLLVITWEDKRLALRQITNVGIWSKDLPLLSSVNLKRPIRASTLKENYIITKLQDCYKQLFMAVPASNLSLWFLFPNEWVRQFHVNNPNYQTEDKIHSYLVWEAEQRLHGDASEYRILLPSDFSEPYLEIRAVKKELVDSILIAALKMNLVFHGSTAEPAQNEAYSITEADNFNRSYVPPTSQSSPRKKLSLKNFSLKDNKPVLWVGGSILALVLCLIIFIMVTSETNGKKSESEYQIAEIINLDTLTPLPVSVDTIPAYSFEAKGTSPVKQFLDALTTGVQVRMLTFSPANLIAELTGVSDIPALLATIKSKSVLSDIEVAGSYRDGNREVIVVRSVNSAWKGIKSQFNKSQWETRAAAVGLKVRKTSARGSYDACLALVDQLWNDPQGVQKIYLADYGSQWNITVQ